MLSEYLAQQSVPEWAKAEFAEAVEAGVADGVTPMQLILRWKSYWGKRQASMLLPI